MSVFLSSQSASPAESARSMTLDNAAGAASSDRPICVHHKGDITVVVYSAPDQEPRRINQAILPSLHIMLVEEGNEVAGLAAILADYLSAKNPNTGGAHASNDCLCAQTVS